MDELSASSLHLQSLSESWQPALLAIGWMRVVVAPSADRTTSLSYHNVGSRFPFGISYRRSRQCECTPGTAPTSYGLPPKPCPPKPYPDELCATPVSVLTPVSLLTLTQEAHNHDAAPFGSRRERGSPLPLRAGTRASGSGLGSSLGGIDSRWCANTLSYGRKSKLGQKLPPW